MPQKSPFFRASCVNEDTSAKKGVSFLRANFPKSRTNMEKKQIDRFEKTGL